MRVAQAAKRLTVNADNKRVDTNERHPESPSGHSGVVTKKSKDTGEP